MTRKENPKESIEMERTEEIPEKNSDKVIEKGNSEKGGEKENPKDTAGEEEKSNESIERGRSRETAELENPKGTTEREDSRESLAGENRDQPPRTASAKFPLPTPEPEPADPSSPNPTGPAGQLVWREDHGQDRDDNHKGLDQPTIKQDSTPPRDGSTPPGDTPNTSKAVKSMLSPPAETKPSTVFDPTQWTDAKFVFGASSSRPSFTFKMETEGSAEDPRNSSTLVNQAKADWLFDWLENDDHDEPVPDRAGGESGIRAKRQMIEGDREPQFLETPGSNTGSNSGPGNNDSQSGGGDGPALNEFEGEGQDSLV